jgi:hypothetical protein
LVVSFRLKLGIQHRLVIVPTHGSVIPKILKDRLTSGFGEGFFVKRTVDDFATLVNVGVVSRVGEVGSAVRITVRDGIVGVLRVLAAQSDYVELDRLATTVGVFFEIVIKPRKSFAISSK